VGKRCWQRFQRVPTFKARNLTAFLMRALSLKLVFKRWKEEDCATVVFSLGRQKTLELLLIKPDDEDRYQLDIST